MTPLPFSIAVAVFFRKVKRKVFAFGRRYLNRIQNAVAVGFFTFIGGCRLRGYLTYSADPYKRHSPKQISRAKSHVFVVDFCCIRPKGFGFQYKGYNMYSLRLHNFDHGQNCHQIFFMMQYVVMNAKEDWH